MAFQTYHVGLIFAVASIITAVVPVAYAQHVNTSAPSNSSASFGKIGDVFTKLTASYDLGLAGSNMSSWRNISQEDFKQVLVPAFQAARPATTAPWVQAKTADLTYNLRMLISGNVPKSVKVDSLYWELARPVGLLFPGATADITSFIASNTTTSNLVNTSIVLTYSSYPPPGAPQNTSATNVVPLMRVSVSQSSDSMLAAMLFQNLLSNSSNAASTNAAAYIRNITGVKGTQSRITNATLSYVVPSGYQARSMTLYPLLNQLSSPDGYFADINTNPGNTDTSTWATKDGSGYNSTKTGDNNTILKVSAIAESNTTNSSNPVQQVTWELISGSMKTEDVSSFFVGRSATYNVSTQVCAGTKDTCCSNCDPTKSCVVKPLCVPKDLSLTLDDQLCIAPSSTPCWQRSYACGNYYYDVSAYADRLYQYYRGFWDFSRQAFNDNMWTPYNGYTCAPWRMISCFYQNQPEYCNGMCTIMQQAMCSKDRCTSWDSLANTTVTDPCCGESVRENCEKTAIPLNASATCQWNTATQSCRLRRFDNCTSTTLSFEEQMLCKTSAILKANSGKTLTDIASNLCSASVTNMCAAPTSQSCTFCQLMQSKLVLASTTTANEANYCRSKGDPAPQYTTAGIQRKQSSLLKDALKPLLRSSTFCNAMASAMFPTGAAALLTANNLKEQRGAGLCNATTVVDQLCDASTAIASSNGTAGADNATRDCTLCGSILDQFAASVAKGASNYSSAHLQSFCMKLKQQEYQAGLAAGQQDDLVEDTCATNWQTRRWWCDPTRGCEHNKLCVPIDASASVDNAACAPLATNASKCNQQANCVFVPTVMNDAVYECTRIAAAVSAYGTYQLLTNPTTVCRMGMGSVRGTCGPACSTGGYCNKTGAGDPQCATACSRCNRCLTVLSAVRQALNTSHTSGSSGPEYWSISQTTPDLLAVYKVCIANMQTTNAISNANAGTNGSSAGQCLGQQHAVCTVTGKMDACNSGYCQFTDTCNKINPSACDASSPTSSGFMCKVAKVCDGLLSSPQALPAATLCGPQYLDACTTSSTSLECTKCLKDADNVQMRLRTSSPYECRTLKWYLTTNVEECTKLVSGWFGAKSICPAVPRVWDQFKQLAYNSTSSMDSTSYEYGSSQYQRYAGFCNNLQNIAKNLSGPQPPYFGRRLQFAATSQGRALLQSTETSPAPEQPSPAPEQPSPAPEQPSPAPAPEQPSPAPAPEQPSPAPAPEQPSPAPAPEQPSPAPAPEQPSPAPEQPSPAAEQPSPAPEQPSPAPEQPSPAPEQPSPAPEQPSPAPEQPSPAPEQPSPAPEQPSPAAEQPSPAPEQPSPAPEQPSPAAEQPSPAAEQPSPAPEQPSPAAEQPSPAPEQPSPAPEQPSPAAEQPSPAAEQPSPAPEQPSPAPEQPSPAPEQPSPAAEQPSPAPEQPSPAAEQPSPAAEQPSPAPEQPSPAPEQPSPAPEQPSPAAEQPSPAAEQPSPAPEQPSPAPEQPSPAPEQPSPAAEQPSPAPEQPSPAPEQPSPAPEQPSPAPEQPSPAPEQPSPAPEQPSPAPEQPSPAPEQPSPAPEEPSPAPEQPSPAPEQPSPAPEEPSPAPEEPSPAPEQPSPAPEQPSPPAKSPSSPAPYKDYSPSPYPDYPYGYTDNGGEGYFREEFNYNGTGNTTVTFTYYAYQSFDQDDITNYIPSWENSCQYVMPDAARAMRGGYLDSTASGFYDACVEFSIRGGATSYMKMFWNNENSCSQWSDSCCTPVGKTAGNQEVCEAQGTCRFSASCTAALSADNCYRQFEATWSNTTNYAICDPSCNFQPMAWVSSSALFAPMMTLRTAADGNVTTERGICYNRTMWDTCASKSSEATCKLWVDGNNTCTWSPTCQPPVTNNFGCQSSTDVCCLESTTATFSLGHVKNCTAQQGAGGRACKVDRQCYLLRDPCSNKPNPWDCLADATCQFTPSASSRMGGVCTTQRQSDPCVGLSAAACNATAMCALADRCVSDRCSDPTDTCCALSGKDAACRAAPTCLVTPTCLPATDECTMYNNATLCQAASFCRWQPMQSTNCISQAGNPTGGGKAVTGTGNGTSSVAGSAPAAAINCGADVAPSSPPPSSKGEGSPPMKAGGNDQPMYAGPPTGVCIMDVSKHPCSAANDQQTCLGLLDAVGKPRCYSQGNCVSQCSRCADCLSDASTTLSAALAQLDESAATDSNKVSQVFSSVCTQKGLDTAVCNRITAAVAFSPQGNLARRSGMVCSLAGQCPAGCTIPVKNATGAIVRQSLDLCTDTGTAAGTPVPPVVKNSAWCMADSDCTGGAWCDLGSAQTQVCQCVAGKDVCNLMGTCNSDLCPRLTELTSVNKDLTSCTNNTDCVAGLVCMSKVFKTYTCSNSRVTATNHTGYCAEAAPGLQAAKLDDTAASITVSLSAPAAAFVTDCGAIFTKRTATKLGKNAICAANVQKGMTILLQSAPSLAWGTDKLELQQNQTALVSSVGARRFAGNSTSVASCTNCPAPAAVLQGPKLVTKPCVGTDPTDFGAVYFDASGSQGTAAAPVTNVVWELASGTSANIAAALAKLADKTDVRDKMILKLDGPILSATDAGDYTLAVTVTNSLNQDSSAVTQFTVADAGAKPSITVFAPGNDASGAVSVRPSKGLKLHSKLQLDSVCKGSASKVNYRWSCTAADESACTLPAEAAAFKQLTLDPADLVGLKLDVEYTFTLTAGFTGSTATSTASMVVRFARSPLRAILTGPMGDIPLRNFTVDASKSSDPDSPTASLKYDFACSPQPCFTDVTYTGSRAKQSAWTIDASKLATINQEYTITATVSGTATGDNRQATASLTVTPRPGNPPTGTVTRFCGYDATGNALACPARHNPTQNMVVTLQLNPGFEAASVQWSVSGDNPQQLVEGVNAQGVRSKTLTVFPSVFPATGSVKLQAIMKMPGVNGTANIAVPLNNPPSCPQPPCFFTDVNSTVFPAYTFVGTASGWQDADGDVLTYEFGQVVDGTYTSQASGPSTTYVFKGFQPGTCQLYSCAIDASGARTCATTSIQVLQPVSTTAEQKTALVEASVGKIDVEQLASTGDVGAVTDAMQEFASLAAYAATTTNAGTGSGPTTTPAVNPNLSQKQNGLLNALVTVMNNKDPAAMSNSMNAADKVSDALPKGLSAQAGNSLISVAEGFVAANADAADVNDNQVKTATKLLSKGANAANTKQTSGTQGRRRALLATATTDPAVYIRLMDTLSGLINLMSATTPVGGTRTAGSSDICMSVSRGNAAAGDLDGKQVALDCAAPAGVAGMLGDGGVAEGRRGRSMLVSVPGAPTVTMPEGFASACAADELCSSSDSTTVSQTYEADPGQTLGTVKSWPDASLLAGTQNGTELTAISGIVGIASDIKTSGPICSNTTCNITVELPMANYNSSLNTTCLRLDPLTGDSSAQLQASTAGVTVVPGSVTNNKVTCTSSAWGKVLAVQYRATVPVVDNSTAGPTDSTTAGYDNSTLDPSEAGEPIAFTFTFANYDYNKMFKSGDTIDTTKVEAFKQAVKESFLAGVAENTKMDVKTADNKLQLNRVNVLNVKPGSVITDLEFIPPASVSPTDLKSFKSTVTTNSAGFFSSPSFTQAYGVPQVTGTESPKAHSNISNGSAIGVGVGVGVGGTLLLAAVLAFLIKRRREFNQMTVSTNEAAGAARYGQGATGAGLGPHLT